MMVPRAHHLHFPSLGLPAVREAIRSTISDALSVPPPTPPPPGIFHGPLAANDTTRAAWAALLAAPRSTGHTSL